ncbi:MBL fold metallo-hydrolase [Rhodococcus antarcticus]|jgi:hydroxyacylglutathione hydrolase|uniref:MBL fold metallo-hydrolase n=1 Tax=Rhodococcus antarcticus TaxID=2987751 RepID=A0ABY6NZJ1_9NOCA|nr:MBL fold metallo-hydrolase [Rhodococcus antarcticus]UZJ24781.1 MBL fold metallo-hydrolase [Rhodococcus antarcticus]
MQVETIETPSLGDRSYLVHDGVVALVVDPQRDTDRVTAAAARLGVRIAAVAETHLHNDYVTGGVHLAQELGVDYLVNAADTVDFTRRPVADGEVVEVGRLRVRVVATPGHTHTHLSYVVTDTGGPGDSAGPGEAVFSGGSLLFGSVGRTDLVSPADTDGLTHDQFHSVRALVSVATDEAALFPTHGFGSFCSSGPATGADSSTVGEQRRSNHALTTTDEDRFVAELIAGLAAYPTYYVHMGPANAHGPSAPDLAVPAPLSADELRDRLAGGGWVVDLRTRRAFADGHLAGTLSFEPGASFVTYLGWTVPWGEPLTLLGSEDDVATAVRELARIGWDHPDAVLGDPLQALPGHPVHSYRRAGWSEVLTEEPALVLDVRRTDEYAAGHLPGALNIPLHELLSRTEEVPDGQVWVHCGSGYRAGVAASVLDRAGRDAVHVDAAFDEAVGAGLTVTTDARGRPGTVV